MRYSPLDTELNQHVVPSDNQELNSRLPAAPRDAAWQVVDQDFDLSQSHRYPNDYNNYPYQENAQFNGDTQLNHRDLNISLSHQSRDRSDVIDMQQYGRHSRRASYEQELDCFDNDDVRQHAGNSRRASSSHVVSRRSNSFANDELFEQNPRELRIQHVPGFRTPQPKNIKYCSQV